MNIATKHLKNYFSNKNYVKRRNKMNFLISMALIAQLFVLINPLSSFPVLMAAYKNKMNVKKIAYSATLIAFVIAVIIALIGPSLFNFFGITVDSFRIAGGIVLLFLGLETINSKKDKETVGKVDSLISILATPLLTGPATISFITLKAFEIGQMTILTNIVAAFILVGAVFIVFAYSIKKINPKIIDITSRVLGLFLAAMAIEMIIHGWLNISA
jgi:multiple antibiotic resistance protein